MKKRFLKFGFLFASAFASSLALTSCRDEFNEKDALKAQQTIDLSVVAYDDFENKGISGASVSIIQDGKEVKQTTNEAGIAVFSGVKIGGHIPVTITKDGFATTQDEVNINTDNYRQSQYSERVNLYSLDGPNTAIIRGKARIETDLTNNEPEFAPVGTAVTAYLHAGTLGEISVKGQVEANGMYSLKVPTIQTGAAYTVVFPTLELDQTIGVNGNFKDQAFPQVEPSIMRIKTTFGTNGSWAPLPGTIYNPTISRAPEAPRSVYAIVAAPNDASVAVKRQAVISRVDVDANGKVTNLVFGDNGLGYTGTVSIEIKSLFGGSGAVVKVPSSFGSLYSETIENGGSGYPTFEFANRMVTTSNSFGNPTVVGQSPSFNSASGILSLRSGEIRIVDVNYGTGLAREKDIQ